jgi:hypothetical protein
MISEGYLRNAGWRGVKHHRVSCESTINFTNGTCLMTFCLIALAAIQVCETHRAGGIKNLSSPHATAYGLVGLAHTHQVGTCRVGGLVRA